MLVASRSRVLKTWMKHGINLWGILICMSTMLIDQHSIADVLCGCGLAFFLLWVKDQITESYAMRNQVTESYLVQNQFTEH
jgi:membrane-associated phospholipid phosphatase